MTSAQAAGTRSGFVTITVGGQLFGIPVLKVQDVLAQTVITRIPQAPPEVAGALNLRGRIVTAIDLRCRLGLPPRDADAPTMSVVVEDGGELYSLVVDGVGEVIGLDETAIAPNPPTLDARWKTLVAGVYRLDGALLLVLDLKQLLALQLATAA